VVGCRCHCVDVVIVVGAGLYASRFELAVEKGDILYGEGAGY
jgi:hypothetical protein